MTSLAQVTFGEANPERVAAFKEFCAAKVVSEAGTPRHVYNSEREQLGTVLGTSIIGGHLFLQLQYPV